MNGAREQHRDFLNRYYGLTHRSYDLSRRYFLFGRDHVLRELAAEPWQRLIEVGPGTGRNLRQLHRWRPGALLGGIEASDVMLAYARRRCPWASLAHGFAEECDFGAVWRAPPDRILFSYCLSMVQGKDAALANARHGLAPGGHVVVVDFADLTRVPAALRAPLRCFLAMFHVTPLDTALLRRHDAASIRFGPGRYWLTARLPALPGKDATILRA